MKTEIKIAVRTLIEQAFHSGDLISGFRSSTRSLEGIRGHLEIQNSRPENYLKEVSVCHRVVTGDYELVISGRIDGIFNDPERIVIDEIKTTLQDPDTLTIPEDSAAWNQIKSYAYIHMVDQDLDIIDAQLTLYQLINGKIREIRCSFTRTELELFFSNLIAQYLEFIDLAAKWQKERDGSIQALDFPFQEYRPGQRRMAVESYRTIRDRGQLIIQAATGIGKSIAALFPAVKAMGEGLTSRIFYLTARTTGRESAEKALVELRKKGLKLRHVTITAKDKICFKPDASCTPAECEFAKGYFDRIDNAIRETFFHDAFTRDVVEKIARDHMVCPFELSLDLSLYSDLIVCDYNYVFDPRVYLRRYFQEQETDYTLLIDEAHNLVDRAREMFSAEIWKQPFLDTRRALKTALPHIHKGMGKINTCFLNIKKRFNETEEFITEQEQPDDIYTPLKIFIKLTEEWLTLEIKTPFREELLDLYFIASSMIRVADLYDENYTTCLEKTGKNLRVKLFCIDPSEHLKEINSKCRAAIFFSATMTPGEYFKNLLGCSEDTMFIDLSSPFPAENLNIIISNRIATTYKERENTAPQVAESVKTFIEQKKGNYLLFFPSYKYMETIHSIFRDISPETEAIVQSRGMTEPERDVFLEKFSHDNPETLAGFVVMGGIFGEGIDLAGDRLSGAVITGVGLPWITPEREVIREHFEDKSRTGFEYAYLYPGINRVLQAAGRVIRSEKDRGTVLLIDRRFSTARYRNLFPLKWRPTIIKDTAHMGNILSNFWRE